MEESTELRLIALFIIFVLVVIIISPMLQPVYEALSGRIGGSTASENLPAEQITVNFAPRPASLRSYSAEWETVHSLNIPTGYHGQIAYTTDRSIWILNLETGVQRRMINTENWRPSCAAWSPDGSRLAFLNVSDDNIYAIEIATGEITRYTEEGTNNSPVWSLDGTRILYDGRNSGGYYVRTIDINTRVEETFIDNMSDPGSANWNPDGRSIVYSAWVNEHYGLFRYDLGTVDSHTTLLLDSNDNRSPEWSPDGRQIVYLAESALYIMDADGSNPHQIIDDTIHATAPTWSPSGEYILFSNRSDEGYLYTVRPDGSELTRLPIGEQAHCPDWWDE